MITLAQCFFIILFAVGTFKYATFVVKTNSKKHLIAFLFLYCFAFLVLTMLLYTKLK